MATKMAIRRLVRGADGSTRIIFVDIDTYLPVLDLEGYTVVDQGVELTPEPVKDVEKPDEEAPEEAPEYFSQRGERDDRVQRDRPSLGTFPSAPRPYTSVNTTSNPTPQRTNRAVQVQDASVAESVPTPDVDIEDTSSVPATEVNTQTAAGIVSGTPRSIPGNPTSVPGYHEAYGNKRPNRPSVGFIEKVVKAANEVKPGSTFVGTSGQGQYGSARHRDHKGVAVDGYAVGPDGVKFNDNEMKDLAARFAYNNPKDAGIGYGPGYMNTMGLTPNRIHLDTFGRPAVWGKNESWTSMEPALRETIAAAREGFVPTPFSGVPAPEERPDFVPVEQPDIDYTSVDPRAAAYASGVKPGVGEPPSSRPAPAVGFMSTPTRVADPRADAYASGVKPGVDYESVDPRARAYESGLKPGVDARSVDPRASAYASGVRQGVDATSVDPRTRAFASGIKPGSVSPKQSRLSQIDPSMTDIRASAFASLRPGVNPPDTQYERTLERARTTEKTDRLARSYPSVSDPRADGYASGIGKETASQKQSRLSALEAGITDPRADAYASGLRPGETPRNRTTEKTDRLQRDVRTTDKTGRLSQISDISDPRAEAYSSLRPSDLSISSSTGKSGRLSRTTEKTGRLSSIDNGATDPRADAYDSGLKAGSYSPNINPDRFGPAPAKALSETGFNDRFGPVATPVSKPSVFGTFKEGMETVAEKVKADSMSPTNRANRQRVDPGQVGAMSPARMGVSLGMFSGRTPAQNSLIDRAIAGELHGDTLRGLTKNDPRALREYANVATSVENRAASGKYKTLEGALVGSQYNSLMSSKKGVTDANMRTFGTSLAKAREAYQAGEIQPTDWGITSYYNAGLVSPSWGRQMANIQKTGFHTFGSLPEYGPSNDFKNQRDRVSRDVKGARQSYSGVSGAGNLDTPSEKSGVGRGSSLSSKASSTRSYSGKGFGNQDSPSEKSGVGRGSKASSSKSSSSGQSNHSAERGREAASTSKDKSSKSSASREASSSRSGIGAGKSKGGGRNAA